MIPNSQKVSIKKSIKEYDTHKLKEVIYGLISLLAVNISMFLHIESTTANQVLFTILGTAFGLWSATFFADILAHHITAKDKNSGDKIKKAFKASLGILKAARTPVVISIIGTFGFTTVYQVVISTIFVIVAQLFSVIILASIRKTNSFWENIGIMLVQALIFAIIIALKIGH